MANDLEKGKKDGSGIHLNRLNLLLILLGLVFAVLMVISMYQTRNTVEEIVNVTENYLDDQQTGGMLQSITPALTEQAIAFVQSGEPGPCMAYEGQMNALDAQIIAHTSSAYYSEEANISLSNAIYAYRQIYTMEENAMALVASTLPEPVFNALPEFLRQAKLSEWDQALDPAAKKERAMAILTSDKLQSYMDTINTEVNNSHKTASDQAQIQSADTYSIIRQIIAKQKLFVFLIMFIGAAALLLNRLLIISPIQRSVQNLDRREPIPERGSYEMRHLARVYNDVLRDNEEKKEALSYTASHDALTDLYNRGAFDRTYKQCCDQHVGILVADVDHFKQYNDNYGHDVGDRVLCAAAEALKRHFRREDYIFRIGGDEFCVIMPETSQSHGEVIREKVLAINQELSQGSEDLPPITVTAGVAFWDRMNPKGNLFKDADSTLLKLKKSRSSVCEIYGELEAEA